MLSEDQKKLVEDNINLVFYFIHRHKLSLEKYTDLGYIGLCKAALTFNPSLGFSFSTYALKCIYNEIFREIRYEKKRENILNTISFSKFIDAEEKITLLDIIGGYEPDFLNDLHNRDSIEQYFMYLNDLNDRDKKVMHLHLRGIKQREIGDKLGLSQAQVCRIIKTTNKKFINKYKIGG